MSWYEVECKVHVRDHNELRNRLKKIGKYIGIEDKKDTYYVLDYKSSCPIQKLRVRDKGDKIEVNYKKSEGYVDGVHAKKETEFSVSDKANFIELIEHFGFRKFIRKHKRTELYKIKEGINLELNFVTGLGWYLEIEKLVQKSEINSARKQIIVLREKLGFNMKDVEKRGYTKELIEKRK